MQGEVAESEDSAKNQGDDYADYATYETLDEQEGYYDGDYCYYIVLHCVGTGIVNSIGRWVTG